MSNARCIAIMLLSAVSIAGCLPAPSEANEHNLRKAIKAHLQAQPLYRESTIKQPIAIIGEDNGYTQVMDELVKLGYASATPEAFEKYSILQKAAPLVVPDESGTGAELRFGIADTIHELIRFSTPQPFGPYLITEVEFTVRWKPTHLLELPKYQDLRDACGSRSIGRIRREIAEVSTQTIELAQYSDGWRVP